MKEDTFTIYLSTSLPTTYFLLPTYLLPTYLLPTHLPTDIGA